jgi:hypothetical protein
MNTIGRYFDLPLAFLAASKLESEGIWCVVADHYLIGVNWQYSLAVGGARLMVREEDEIDAVRALQDDQSQLLEEMDGSCWEEEGAGPDRCEECGSQDLQVTFPARKFAALTLLLNFIPFFAFLVLAYIFRWRFVAKCLRCGSVQPLPNA